MNVSQRPFLLRALYQWILANDWTPYVQVDTSHAKSLVPQKAVDDDGTIVLNLNPAAIHQLQMDDHLVSFQTRFGGQIEHIQFSPLAVLIIFARENGQGMSFPPPEDWELSLEADSVDDVTDNEHKSSMRKSHLKVIK